MRVKRIILFLSIIASLVWLAVFSFPDNKVHLIFCNVGEGDAILITRGFNQILIDGGPNDKVLSCLKNNMPFFDKTLEIVALTHPDADHLTGLVSVMEKYQITLFLTGPEGNTSAVFAELRSGLREGERNGKVTIKNPYLGEKIKLGDVVLDTLWPEKEWVAQNISFPSMANTDDQQASRFVLGAQAKSTELNPFSLVFLLEYGPKKVLLMGDADSKVQDKIMVGNVLGSVDILKFPHHGSKTGITKEFLEKTQPKEAVISVGRNSFGHPTSEALDLLKRSGIQVRRTDLEGEIEYVFN